MDREEYNRLFHKHKLNLVAFKPLNDCDEEVLKLVNAAIEAEREACAVIAFNAKTYIEAAAAIRARGQQ